MIFSFTLFENFRSRVVFCGLILLFIAGQPLVDPAAAATRAEFEDILKDNLEALWTGREFSAAMKQRQQILKTMLANGEVEKSELAKMIEKALLPIMDRRETSRYFLKLLPERVNALFTPYMNWEEFETVMWRSLSSSFKTEGPIVFKCGSLAPPGTPWLTVAETIGFPELEQRLARGRLQTKLYGGGVMGDDREVLQKMENGELDDCGCTALGMLEACPESSVLMLPGLFRNYDEVDYISEKFRKRLDESFEKRGYTLLALIDTGFLNIFSGNKITGLDDMRRENVLSWFGEFEKTFYTELGISPDSVDVPDLVATLNNIRDNIMMAPPSWVLGMQAYPYLNYYFKQPVIYTPGAIIVGSYMKDKIRQHLDGSEIFFRNFMEVWAFEWSSLESEWKRQIRNYEEKCLKAFETKCGMKALTFSPEDQQAIEKASKTVQQKVAGKLFPKDFINDIQKALEEYRAVH